MANLFKIKEIARSKKMSIKSLAASVGISEPGLQKLIRENSTRVETLELIAKSLNVPIMVFFDDSPNNLNECEYKYELEIANIKIQYLENMLKDKEEIIELLRNKK